MIRLLLLCLISFQASALSLEEIQQKQASLQKEADAFQKRADEARRGETCKGLQYISFDNMCQMENASPACIKQNNCIINVRNAEHQLSAVRNHLRALKLQEIEAKKWADSPQGKLAKNKELQSATKNDLNYFEQEAKATRESALCKDVNFKEDKCVLRTLENYATFCKRRKSCIDQLAMEQDGVSGKTRALEDLKKAEAELIAEIEKDSRVPARSLAELEGKEIVLPDPRGALDMNGYNGDEETAFGKTSRGACIYTLSPVEDFPSSGGYALPKKAVKWRVGQFTKGEKIKDRTVCSTLPFMYRAECRKELEGPSMYFAPNFVELTAPDGKIMKVLAKENLSDGVFNCIKNASFDTSVPASGAKRDTEVATAPETTK